MTAEDELAVVLFEGAGGSTCGLRDAGYRTIGFEFWAIACATARLNGHVSNEVDLSDPANDWLIPKARVLWASPPCQPFSAAGDGDGEFDDRDGFPWMLRIIASHQPEVVFIENVKGLTFTKHDAYFTGVLTMLRKLGYEVEWKVLNCADYGVPQTRERCIIIARRDDGPIVWPMPTHTEQPGLFTEQWVSMSDALGWGMTGSPFPTVAGCNDTGGFDPWGVGGSGARAKIRSSRDEGRWVLNTGRDWQKGGTREDAQTITADRPAPAVDSTGGGGTRWHWTADRPATTIAGDPRVFSPGGHIANDGRNNDEMVGRSEDAIRCTVAELATLQGFPAGYVFTGTKTAQAKQVGNAVPPKLAEVLARANRPVTR